MIYVIGLFKGINEFMNQKCLVIVLVGVNVGTASLLLEQDQLKP